MIGRLFAAALFCVATFASVANAQVVSHRADVVVELYTSQGCTQCPRANRLMDSFSEEDGVLALTLPVSIWDYLGWRDTFATPEFTFRQRAYSRALRVRRLTPQLIFDGARHTSASNWDEARAILDQSKATPLSGPDISITRPRSNRLRITIGPGQRREPADVWLITYDPGPVSMIVTNGVNLNRRVAHYNLVSSIHTLGQWTGEPVYFERTRCSPECAVIVQEQNGGRILSAAFTASRR
jgi:hypothetical protein